MISVPKLRHSPRVKRVLDITIALGTLAALWPLMLLIAVAIRATSRGPAIFRQQRVGLLGKDFTIFKFRTMSRHHGASGEPILRLRHSHAEITLVGGFLRRTKLDELPQLFNVLRGNMSLVGPRPYLRGHTAGFPEERHQVQPGMTGWSQLYRIITSDESLSVELTKDLAYVRHGIDNWLDLVCLCNTPWQLAKRIGRAARRPLRRIPSPGSRRQHQAAAVRSPNSQEVP